MLATAVLLLLAQLVMAELDPPERWAETPEAIHQIAPDEYPGLPSPVVRYLLRHGYRIPQTYDEAKHHNVVRGRFDGDSHSDLAVLGSRDGYSQVLVFWGGSPHRVSALERHPDADYLRSVGGGKVGYSRSISVVGRDYILEHHRRYGVTQPPPIRHDGIDDGFVGKASAVRYLYRGRWLTLQGAD
jgi:hypothetical protein